MNANDSQAMPVNRSQTDSNGASQPAAAGGKQSCQPPKKLDPMEDLASTVSEQQWFHAASHTIEIKRFVKSVVVEQPLHMVDLFSASGNGASTFASGGYPSEAVGILRDERHDITTKAGFFFILAMCCRLVPNALILAGPPCMQSLRLPLVVIASENG